MVPFFVALLRVVSILAWLATGIGVLLGLESFWITLTQSTGAPQQAAGAAVSLCWAILPYVFARTAQEMATVLEKLDSPRGVESPTYQQPAVSSQPAQRYWIPGDEYDLPGSY